MKSVVTLLPLCAALLAAACTSHTPSAPDEPPHAGPPPVSVPEPAPEPEPVPEPPPRVVELRATISSIAFAQDCPDEPAAASPSRAEPASAVPQQARGDVAHGMWPPPCRQSTMQLTLRHDGNGMLPVSIVEARLVDAIGGDQLGTVGVRGPTRWDDAGQYLAWDEQIPGATEIRASYKLSASDNRLAPRSVLEVDVRFEGRIITLRSPEFHHMPPEVMVT